MKPANPNAIRKSCSIAGWATLIAVCALIGTFLGNKLGSPTAPSNPVPLVADSSVKGKTLSLATGLVSPQVEGLYVLDHASGLLQCWIMNPRTGAVGGIYQANVVADFAAVGGLGEKMGAGDYVMVTGGFQFTGGITGNRVPSNSIVYIADEATGNVLGYNFAYDKTMLSRGVMQQGVLTVVCKGPTRGGAVVEREQ